MDRPGVWQVPEGRGEQGKMEKTGCKIICGALLTLTVKESMMMTHAKQNKSHSYLINGLHKEPSSSVECCSAVKGDVVGNSSGVGIENHQRQSVQAGIGITWREGWWG